jgi:hypothetical protein
MKDFLAAKVPDIDTERFAVWLFKFPMDDVNTMGLFFIKI